MGVLCLKSIVAMKYNSILYAVNQMMMLVNCCVLYVPKTKEMISNNKIIHRLIINQQIINLSTARENKYISSVLFLYNRGNMRML